MPTYASNDLEYTVTRTFNFPAQSVVIKAERDQVKLSIRDRLTDVVTDVSLDSRILADPGFKLIQAFVNSMGT